jgi:hypothetical protein
MNPICWFYSHRISLLRDTLLGSFGSPRFSEFHQPEFTSCHADVLQQCSRQRRCWLSGVPPSPSPVRQDRDAFWTVKSMISRAFVFGEYIHLSDLLIALLCAAIMHFADIVPFSLSLKILILGCHSFLLLDDPFVFPRPTLCEFCMFSFLSSGDLF